MGKKYIIELEDNESVYKTIIANGYPMLQVIVPAPYTEPDLDAIRNEAYEKGAQDTKQHWVDAPRTCAYKLGYENGLNDAWEAARKVVALSTVDRRKVFGSEYMYSILEEHTASEAIEKIRAYEQEQKSKDGLWIMSEANEPSADTTLICSKCGYAIKIKPYETPELNFCPKCGDCKNPKEEES